MILDVSIKNATYCSLLIAHPAAVSVPKSLLIKFEFMKTLYANFLVTNSKTLPNEAQ
jgi:hypothetical protein